MTVIVKIEPVETKTHNGKTRARITGIDLMSGDPFIGEIEYEPGKWTPARWRSNGNARDAHPDWNLVMGQYETRMLYEAASKLNARLI